MSYPLWLCCSLKTVKGKLLEDVIILRILDFRIVSLKQLLVLMCFINMAPDVYPVWYLPCSLSDEKSGSHTGLSQHLHCGIHLTGDQLNTAIPWIKTYFFRVWTLLKCNCKCNVEHVTQSDTYILANTTSAGFETELSVHSKGRHEANSCWDISVRTELSYIQSRVATANFSTNDFEINLKMNEGNTPVLKEAESHHYPSLWIIIHSVDLSFSRQAQSILGKLINTESQI